MDFKNLFSNRIIGSRSLGHNCRVCPERVPAPGTLRQDPDVSGVGEGRGAPGQGPKLPEKAGWVSLDFIKTSPEVPPRGSQGRTPTFQGWGQVGVDSVDLRVPQGRARRSLEGQGGAVLGVSRLIGYPTLYYPGPNH